MSNKAFNAKYNNKAKKGISPVIATVILVAVAVVIAAALAGFSGSLFGSYSQGSQAKLVSATLDSTTNDLTLVFSNAGAASDSVVSATINPGAAVPAPAGNTIAANTGSDVAGNTVTIGMGGPFNQGQQYTATILMKSGTSITQTLNAQ